MNDKVKEILDYIDDKIIPNEKFEQIRNYITNLQEENKILKELNICVGCNNSSDYKSRIDKAIEYVEDNTYKSYYTDYMDLTGIKELLNILNGGDEE